MSEYPGCYWIAALNFSIEGNEGKDIEVEDFPVIGQNEGRIKTR